MEIHGARTQSVRSPDGVSILYNRYPYSKEKESCLVFLHGLGGDLTAWYAERTLLAKKGYQTLAIDLRGHGLSERPKDEVSYTFSRFSDDVKAVLIKENIKKAVVIGHCLGGMVALTLAAEQPTFLKGLILVDTGFKPAFLSKTFAHHPFFDKLLHLVATHSPRVRKKGHVDFNQFMGTEDINAQRIFSDIFHTSIRSYLLSFDQIAHLNAVSLLKKIVVPTLIIEGEKDSIFPLPIAKELAHRIKHSHLDVIPNANHILVINNPVDVTEEILRFARKLPED